MEIFNNVNSIFKMVAREKLSEGDRIIDATVGNGNDMEYLMEIVGKSGFGYGFDIQSEAVLKTMKRLDDKNIKNVEIICDGHENADRYISGNINLAVFNLGYLPRADHNIITKPQTTVEAIEKILGMLADGGVICISSYKSHEGGMEENDAVTEYISSLDQKRYNVLKSEFRNQKNNPPDFMIIEKRK